MSASRLASGVSAIAVLAREMPRCAEGQPMTTRTRPARRLLVRRGAVAAVVVALALLTPAAVLAWPFTDAETPAAAEPPPSAATSKPEPSRRNITNRPTQAAGILYDSPSDAEAYARRGSLVVAGRTNYGGRGFKQVSRAGGTVLIYLDVVVDNAHGRYHRMLMRRSACGPRIGRWPGSPTVNARRYLNDFRVGSVLQRKLACVLERMVVENPHMGGWFADDVGSRSHFPGFDWSSWGQANQRAYRAGAIAIARTFRRVANEHGLIFLVNGTWGAGSLASDGGGYPDIRKSGNALADGGFVEHHDGQIGYFGPYGCSRQWAAASPVTRGKAVNFALTRTVAGRLEYVASNCFAYVNNQTDYGIAPRWGASHPSGLPTHVR